LMTWSVWNIIALILWVVLIASNYFLCHDCAIYDPNQSQQIIECLKNINKNYSVPDFNISLGQQISNHTD
jgi:hypothetical protein